MSWFDAASFTSYAKTALASAQKSIDKVLDIDDGGTSGGNDSQNTTKISLKDKEYEENLGSSFKTSTPKPTSSSSPKRSLSKEKLKDQAKTSEDNSDDFWSSFLGSSDSNAKDKKQERKKASRSGQQLERKNSDSLLAKKAIKKLENNKPNESINSKDNTENQNQFFSHEAQANVAKERQHSISKDNSTKNDQTESKKTDFSGSKTSNKRVSRKNKGLALKGIRAADESLKDDKSFVDVSLEQEIAIKEDGEKKDVKLNENVTQDDIDKTDTGKNKDLEFDKTIDETLHDGLHNSKLLSPNGAPKQFSASLEQSYDEQSKDEVTGAPDANDMKHTNYARTQDIEMETGRDNLDHTNETAGSGNSGHEIAKELSLNTLVDSTYCVEAALEDLSEKSQDVDDLTDEAKELRKNDELVLSEEVKENKLDKKSYAKEPSEDDYDGEVGIKGIVFKEEDIIAEEETLADNEVMNSADFGKAFSSISDSDVSKHQNPNDEQRDMVNIVYEESPFQSEGECTYPTGVREDVSKEDSSDNVQQLIKEISDLKELVTARENKVVSLSKENIDYQETNAILRSQIEQLENLHAGENEEFEELREEFTTRIASAENRYHDAADERDQLRNELEKTVSHLTDLNNRQKEEYTTLVAEKDDQIAQLLSEGEKLSKQELQSNTVIKKLRAREKENDALIKKQTNKIQEYKEEVERLTDILTSRDDSNSKQEDAIIKLNSYVKKQDEQLNKQASDLEDANEKVRSMQVALDNAYKEMTSLQKKTASTDSTIQEAVLSTEMKAKEEMRIALEKSRREFEQEGEMMALQVADLQTNLTRAEQQSTRREENLRQEIKHLQQRLQESEDRNQELAGSVSNATRPLLRQIENLQATHNGQAFTWEKVEKNLTDRLNEAQSQLLKAQEKEHIASHSVSELSSKIARLESQVNTYRAERSRLEADLEIERTKTGTLEDAQSRDVAKYEAMVRKYQKLIEDANLDKAHVEQQMTVERSKMDAEVMKLKSSLEEKEKLLSRQTSFSGINVRRPSSDGTNIQNDYDTTGNPTSGARHSRTSSTSSVVIDGLTKGIMGGTTALVERLQAQVKQKDGEIELLQDDVTSLRQSRDSVMEELTSLTEKLERLEASHAKYNDLKDQYDALQQRYNAVLQMYGEKEEEAEELKMDLQDVKSMYKQQLEQLFGSTR